MRREYSTRCATPETRARRCAPLADATEMSDAPSVFEVRSSVMECSEVLEAVRLGEEGHEIYEHLAHCDSCRNKVERTQFVEGKDDPTDKRPPAAIGQRRRMRLQLIAIIAGVLLPLGIIGTVAVVVLRKKPEAPSLPPVTIAAPVPKVQPLAVPLPVAPAPAPAATLRKLAVDAQPPGSVYIDGKKLGDTPFTVDVAPGRVLVEVRAEGFRTAHKVLQIGDEDPKPLAFTLQPKGESEAHDLPPPPPASSASASASAPASAPDPKPAPPARKEKDEDDAEPATDEPKVVLGTTGYGFLTISTEPKFAKVFVDGKDTGRTTPVSTGSPLRLGVGKHKVRLRIGSRHFDYDVQISEGQTTKLVETLPVSPHEEGAPP
jgi:hypothetical protein